MLLRTLEMPGRDKIFGLHDDEWNGNRQWFSFTAAGLDISGSLIVERESVEISATIPILHFGFGIRFEEAVRAQAAVLFAKTT